MLKHFWFKNNNKILLKTVDYTFYCPVHPSRRKEHKYNEATFF